VAVTIWNSLDGEIDWKTTLKLADLRVARGTIWRPSCNEQLLEEAALLVGVVGEISTESPRAQQPVQGPLDAPSKQDVTIAGRQ